MAGRYLVTGVQLGILMSGLTKAPRNKLLREILENQFVGNSDCSIEEDVELLNIYPCHGTVIPLI